jgi:cytochrome c-type biogenesis protein CcmH
MRSRPPRAPVRAILAAATVLLCFAGPAAAASPQEIADDVARAVMSPFCPGLTLHDCPSDSAVRLRERIEEWARAGASESSILRRLENEFGPSILAAPPRTGAGWLVWLAPAAALVAGGCIALGLARRWSGRRAGAPAPSPSATAEERARLDAELAALRDPPHVVGRGV